MKRQILDVVTAGIRVRIESAIVPKSIVSSKIGVIRTGSYHQGACVGRGSSYMRPKRKTSCLHHTS